MVGNTFHKDATFSIPPARLFKAFVLDDINFLPKVAPQVIKSVEYVQGDGGAGTIKLVTFAEAGLFKSSKHRVDGVDKANFTYRHTIIEVEVKGDLKNDSIEALASVLKFEPSADGGSIVKATNTYHTKGGAPISEEFFNKEIEHVFAMFKAAEAYLAANPGAYN